MKLTTVPIWFLLLAALAAAGFWGTSNGTGAGAVSAQTGAPAQPNELISLTVTVGSGANAVWRPLTPRFVSSVSSYDTYVGAYTTTAQIVMEAANDAATISLNGDDAVAGSRTETVSLDEGHNRFAIVVTPMQPAAGARTLVPATYHLNIRREPVPRLAFEPAYLLMNEGETATYTVALDTRWLGAEVTVAIASDNPDITVSPTQVSFRPTDWDPRTIKVTVADDADSDDDFTTLDHNARGGHFNNVYGRLRVEVSDDDSVPAVSAQTGAPAQVATLTAVPGDQPGTIVLAWTPAAGATRYWIAGIKQTDWDAGDFSGVIWEAASGASTHTVAGLDEGSLYALTVAGGNAAGQWGPWSPLSRVTTSATPSTEYPEPPTF